MQFKVQKVFIHSHEFSATRHETNVTLWLCQKAVTASNGGYIQLLVVELKPQSLRRTETHNIGSSSSPVDRGTCRAPAVDTTRKQLVPMVSPCSDTKEQSSLIIPATSWLLHSVVFSWVQMQVCCPCVNTPFVYLSSFHLMYVWINCTLGNVHLKHNSNKIHFSNGAPC